MPPTKIVIMKKCEITQAQAASPPPLRTTYVNARFRIHKTSQIVPRKGDRAPAYLYNSIFKFILQQNHAAFCLLHLRLPRFRPLSARSSSVAPVRQKTASPEAAPQIRLLRNKRSAASALRPNAATRAVPPRRGSNATHCKIYRSVLYKICKLHCLHLDSGQKSVY